MRYTTNINGQTISLKNILYITEITNWNAGRFRFTVVYRKSSDMEDYDNKGIEIELLYGDHTIAKKERLELVDKWDEFLSKID